MTEQLTVKAETVTSRVMRTPRTLDVEITARCNLRCRYCYFFDNPALKYEDLSTDEWLEFFSELGQLGVMDVFLSGGEPFMRPDLPALIEGLTRHRLRFGLSSNGMFIEDDIAASIAGSKRCNFVQVSLDGSNPETHDAARGEDSFEGAIRSIKTLLRHGVKVMVRTTLHRKNVHDLENLAHLVLDELGVKELAINVAGYLGACRANEDDILRTKEERQAAMRIGLHLIEQYDGSIAADQSNLLIEARLFGQMEAARSASAPAFANGGHLTACGCLNYKLAVRPDGTIVPCAMLPHIELGRINQDSLTDVWQNSEALNQLRRRRGIPLTDFDFCAGCEYIPYCTGNCPGVAYTRLGQVNHPNPDSCLRRFLDERDVIF